MYSVRIPRAARRTETGPSLALGYPVVAPSALDSERRSESLTCDPIFKSGPALKTPASALLARYGLPVGACSGIARRHPRRRGVYSLRAGEVNFWKREYVKEADYNVLICGDSGGLCMWAFLVNRGGRKYDDEE